MGNVKRIYISPKEASEISGITVGYLANLRFQKKGPKYYKPLGSGKRYRVFYRRDEFLAWLESEPVLTIDSIENK